SASCSRKEAEVSPGTHMAHDHDPAQALDRGHAPYASLGTPRPPAHARIALVFGGDCGPALSGSCDRIPRHLPGPAIRHDLGGWNLGSEARCAVEEVRAHPAMGRPGFRHLADQLYAQQHPLAGWPILHPRWQARARDFNPWLRPTLSPRAESSIASASRLVSQHAACAARRATLSVAPGGGCTHEFRGFLGWSALHVAAGLPPVDSR